MYFWFWKYIASHKGKLFNEQSLYFWQDIKRGRVYGILEGGGGGGRKKP